jgi:Leucine-rich repeat (LRR) protein
MGMEVYTIRYVNTNVILYFNVGMENVFLCLLFLLNGSYSLFILQWNENQGLTSPNNGSNNHGVNRRDSSVSVNSASSAREVKTKGKQRAAERRRKLDAQHSEVDIGHIVDDTDLVTACTNVSSPSSQYLAEIGHGTSLDRSSSDQSTGSLLYGKTPNSGTFLGKSSSLIFPTGVDASRHVDSETDSLNRRKVNLLLDQCESMRFPFKKKLMLNNMGLTAADIPLNYLCGTSLGNSLHKLSLAGNRLGCVPPRLVQSLPTLKHLDLSQCELHQLPDKWNLPQLKRLNLSHNSLKEFPEEVRTRHTYLFV